MNFHGYLRIILCSYFSFVISLNANDGHSRKQSDINASDLFNHLGPLRAEIDPQTDIDIAALTFLQNRANKGGSEIVLDLLSLSPSTPLRSRLIGTILGKRPELIEPFFENLSSNLTRMKSPPSGNERFNEKVATDLVQQLGKRSDELRRNADKKLLTWGTTMTVPEQQKFLTWIKDKELQTQDEEVARRLIAIGNKIRAKAIRYARLSDAIEGTVYALPVLLDPKSPLDREKYLYSQLIAEQLASINEDHPQFAQTAAQATKRVTSYLSKVPPLVAEP